MDAKQKRNVVDDIKALLPFIQAESFGIGTRKAIVKILGQPDECGLVRWCNEHKGALTQEGQVVKDTIQILVRLYARFGQFSKHYADQDAQIEEAQRLLPKKIAILETLCVDTKKPKLERDEIKPTLEKFLVGKMDSGERFRGQEKYKREFHAMYGAGSVGLVNTVLGSDERLQAWSKDKSVSAKSYAEVHATAQALEYIDDSELDRAFLKCIMDLPPEQRESAKKDFDAYTPQRRKELIDAMRS